MHSKITFFGILNVFIQINFLFFDKNSKKFKFIKSRYEIFFEFFFKSNFSALSLNLKILKIPFFQPFLLLWLQSFCLCWNM